MNALLQSSSRWSWTKECEEAFALSKQLLLDSTVLTHYDISLPVTLACDASSYGVGAVLSHRFRDGVERPIAFASRTLSSSERNYSQIEREALSIVFGISHYSACHYTNVEPCIYVASQATIADTPHSTASRCSVTCICQASRSKEGT